MLLFFLFELYIGGVDGFGLREGNAFAGSTPWSAINAIGFVEILNMMVVW